MILIAGRDFKTFFLDVTTLHNRNEFRTNAAVRNFVSRLHNCQAFWVSHRRTSAQAHKRTKKILFLLFFGKTGASTALVISPLFCLPFFVPYKKLLCGCAFVRRFKTPRNYWCFIQRIAQTLLCAAQLKSHNHRLWILLLHSCAALPGLHGLPMRKG